MSLRYKDIKTLSPQYLVVTAIAKLTQEKTQTQKLPVLPPIPTLIRFAKT